MFIRPKWNSIKSDFVCEYFFFFFSTSSTSFARERSVHIIFTWAVEQRFSVPFFGINTHRRNQNINKRFWSIHTYSETTRAPLTHASYTEKWLTYFLDSFQFWLPVLLFSLTSFIVVVLSKWNLYQCVHLTCSKYLHWRRRAQTHTNFGRPEKTKVKLPFRNRITMEANVRITHKKSEGWEEEKSTK